jgi:hypothetical protein
MEPLFAAFWAFHSLPGSSLTASAASNRWRRYSAELAEKQGDVNFDPGSIKAALKAKRFPDFERWMDRTVG